MNRASRKAVDHKAVFWLPTRLRDAFCCFALCIGLAPWPALADSNLTVVLSGTADYYLEVAEAFRNTLSAGESEVDLRLLKADQLARAEVPPDQLVVAIGTEATAKVMTQLPESPLLSLFVTESAWHSLVARTPSHSARRGVVFINQPLDRFIYLATLLKPNSKTLATVFGPASQRQRQSFAAQAQQQGLQLISRTMNVDANPVATLTPLFNSTDIFVALPDQGLFNRTVARWALYLGFKHKIPLVGFSRSYTQAGALASLFSSPENIGRQGGEWAEDYLRDHDENLWQEFSPRYFTVEINPSVARALGIATPHEEAIYQQLVERLDQDEQP